MLKGQKRNKHAEPVGPLVLPLTGTPVGRGKELLEVVARVMVEKSP